MRETNKSKAAFEDYYSMGSGRSLQRLADRYRVQTATEPRPPTLRLATLKTWSTAHSWQERVAQRDTEIAIAQFEAIKAKAMEAGYAFWPKRVQDLVALADLLLEEIKTEDKRWVPDWKQIGSGYSAKQVRIFRFNSPLIREFRQTLDDIASEMGERIKSVALSGKDGEPIAIDLGTAARDTLLGRLLSPVATEGD